MRIRRPLLLCALLIAASGCSKRDPVADNANGAALPDPENVAAPDASGGPPAAINGTHAVDNSAPATAVNPKSIPFLLHGRWGLTPEDCTSTRGDAKGLLMISDYGLRFYESRAVPGADVQSTAASISGTFAFTGEGQSWSKYEALEVIGNKLTRTENNPATSYTNAKC